MPTTTPSFGVLQKAIRTNITKIKAESMKPPQEVEDETGGDQHKFYLVYVANGKEVRGLCTQPIWKKVLGPKAQPGRKLPGYDNKIHHDFFVISDPKTGLILDVDLVPKNLYARGAVPENLEGEHSMELLINPGSGQIEITKLPPKVLDAKIREILDTIDKLELIEPGQEIAGCEVVSVAGNRIQLDIPQA
jgi:hypothetical protein